MPNTPTTPTAPKYVSAFACVGGACEETCCTNFVVDVDRGTFQGWMAVREPGIGGDLRKYVKKHTGSRSQSAFARIKASKGGACPFLDADRLCTIQNRLGEDALSETCRSYPRETWERDGGRYLGMKASCPEAARLLVSSPDAMDFPDAPAEPAGTVRGAVCAAIEEVARDTALPVWKAIIFAGVITETFLPDDVAEGPAGGEALQAIADSAAETKAVIAQQDFVDGDPATPFKLLMQMALTAAGKANSHNRLPQIVQTALDEITGAAAGFDDAAARYAQLYETRFKPFDDAHGHALRNFVLNYLYLKRLFQTGPALPQFQNLAVRYGVMRMLLVGLSGARKEGLSLADYAAVVSAVSRIMDHDASMNREVCAALDAVEPKSVPLAARLVIPPG